MTTTVTIRPVNGTVAGTLSRESVIGVETARTFLGLVVGDYNESLDRTHRVTGQLFGAGNLLGVLTVEADTCR